MSSFFDVINQVNKTISLLSNIESEFINIDDVYSLKAKTEDLIEQIHLLNQDDIVESKFILMEEAIQLRVRVALLFDYVIRSVQQN